MAAVKMETACIKFALSLIGLLGSEYIEYLAELVFGLEKEGDTESE